jgi:acyl-coenzyme A thioesterase PaaI-like protein
MTANLPPPGLRDLWKDDPAHRAGSPYGAMIDRLRVFLDQLAGAAPDDETAAALGRDLALWTKRLELSAVGEAGQMFARVHDAPGRGQVMSPAYTIEEQDETSLRAVVNFGRYFLGANGAVHGGAISLLFDEVLGMPANFGTMTMARTASLHVNYRSITPIETDLELTARMVSVNGRKRIVRGELRHGERLCAEGEGLFIELKPGQQ